MPPSPNTWGVPYKKNKKKAVFAHFTAVFESWGWCTAGFWGEGVILRHDPPDQLQKQSATSM